ncbi:hypothetical protein F5Y10DRAFT_263486 [Nemania abortiva]|nr:hypothetical protein F5Y10DRAFT_263486 [Nemania abortiva]
MPGTICADSPKHIHKGEEESDGVMTEAGSRRATRGDEMAWDKFQSVLHDLYVIKGNPLPVVMDTMKTKYRFKKSVKQCTLTHLTAHRYKLGEKWGWKKYNQGGTKHPSTRSRLRRPSNMGNLQEEVSDVSDGSDRNTTPLDEQLAKVFTNQQFDDRTLDNLRTRNDVSRWLRPFLLWCREEMLISEAHHSPSYSEPAPVEEAEGPDRHYCALQICLVLLHRYNEPPSAPSRYRNWDNIARKTVGVCSAGMLLIMSNLIVTIATEEWQGDPTTPPSGFEIAKLGIDTAISWDDTMLVEQFCKEFEDFLKHYTTIRDATQRYLVHIWPTTLANVYLGDGQPPINYTWPGTWHGPTGIAEDMMLSSEGTGDFTSCQSDQVHWIPVS